MAQHRGLRDAPIEQLVPRTNEQFPEVDARRAELRTTVAAGADVEAFLEIAQGLVIDFLTTGDFVENLYFFRGQDKIVLERFVEHQGRAEFAAGSAVGAGGQTNQTPVDNVSRIFAGILEAHDPVDQQRDRGGDNVKHLRER